MTYQVLARKWRPKSFDSFVGQEHVVRALRNALTQQRLHHAYLLTGTRGVGKTTLARIISKALNCDTGITDSPCGTCTACVGIDNGRFVDLLEIDAASNTGIDNIREVLENAQYAPTAGRFKIYIIDEVHMLSKSAFNAMLKTLEEPPPHAKFILATTDPQKVPITVLSRCLQFSLKQMTPQLIAKQLAAVLDDEQISYEPAALTLLAYAASGSMRDALSLLDQAIAYHTDHINELSVQTMLGAIDRQYVFDLLKKVQAQDGLGVVELIDELQSTGIDFEAALAEILHVLHQLALVQTVPNAVDQETPHYADIKQLATVLTPEEVQLYYQIALHGRQDLALAPDEHCGFSMTLLRMLAFAPVEPGNQPIPASSVTNNTADNMTAVREQSGSPIKPKPNVDSKVQDDTLPALAAKQQKSTARLKTFELAAWPTVVQQLKGMSKMLAQNSSLVAIEESVLILQVAEKDKLVAERMYQEKLKTELSDYFAEKVTLQVHIVPKVTETPLLIQQRTQQTRQLEAEQHIHQDPFVQTLITEFGATIVPDSIIPIG